MARLIETDSYTNKDISSAVAIGAYTANATRLVHVRVAVDQAAGGGDYVIYVTLQIGGAGSSYVVIPKTTATAAAGETALMFVGGPIPVDNTDVLTVMLDGLAGDTTTPDTRVSFYEHNYLAPATADRTLTVAATGEASANVTMSAGIALGGRLAEYADLPSEPLDATATQAAAAAALAAYDPPTKAELDAGLLALVGGDGDTLESLSDQIDLVAGGAAGSGAIEHTITVDDGVHPLDGAEVWISTDEAGANVVAGTLSTDALGQVTFLLDAGTYWKHVQLAGYNFTATEFTVA